MLTQRQTLDLVTYAQTKLGYAIEKVGDEVIRGANFWRKAGTYVAEKDGFTAKAQFDSGARRATPGEFKFRKGSPHHVAVLELLKQIAEHSGDRYLAARLEPKQ